MKYLIQVCIVAALFCACKSSSTSAPPTTDSTAVAIDPTTAMLGLYKGDFGGANIYITINYAKNNHIAGYNVHKGLRRNISGSYKEGNGIYILEMSEPGDHPFDGKFELKLAADFNSATGTWTPINKGNLKTKSFELTKVPEDKSGYKGYTLGADHRDITFESDGSVVLNYYEKTSDSTFVGQMTTLRGTYEQTGDSIVVTWEKKSDIPTPATGYKLMFSGEGEDHWLNSAISTDSIEYWVGP